MPRNQVQFDEADLSPSLSARLRQGTRADHEALDGRIMQADPFATPARYAGLVKVNHAFLTLTSPLYRDPELERRLPGLAQRDRAGAAAQDLADLGAAPLGEPLPEAPAAADLPQAVGWLYVAEGSNLGAAFLLKAVQPLGFDAQHGARHLAAPEVGRGRHWGEFTAAMDALGFDEQESGRVVTGARAAFAAVRALVEHVYFQVPHGRIG